MDKTERIISWIGGAVLFTIGLLMVISHFGFWVLIGIVLLIAGMIDVDKAVTSRREELNKELGEDYED